MLRHLDNGSRRGGEWSPYVRFAAGLMGLLSSGLWPSLAQAQGPAPSKASCAEAYESAQESRASGALQETRSRLAYCAQTECPAFVQKDCARWLGEVDKELPSIIVSLVGLEGEASRGASLKIDGKPVEDPLSGKAILLDPGQHELVLQLPGAEPLTRTILAQQGVQNRSVELRLGAAPAENASPAFETDAVPPRSPLRSIAYVSWGVGAVGLGAFAVLGTLARADKDRFEQDCAGVTSSPELLGPGVCLESTVDSREAQYKREEVLADVGLITGIVGAATGTVLFVLSMNHDGADQAKPAGASSAALHLDVAPARGGAWASLTGSF
jgi:hypothetical protein